jgi:metal-responsive CopG/Arc/MetJ family transcriptional regulator
MREKETERNFGAVSISIGILEEIDKLIQELRYWPSRSAFIREACLEKIKRDRQERDKKLRETANRRML